MKLFEIIHYTVRTMNKIQKKSDDPERSVNECAVRRRPAAQQQATFLANPQSIFNTESLRQNFHRFHAYLRPNLISGLKSGRSFSS